MISFSFQIKVVVVFKLKLLTLIENSFKDSNSSISEWMKLTFLMITFCKQIILSLLFMWILWNESGCLLSMRMNKNIFTDDYFLLIIKSIPLLFMWISWNKSDCKWFHTLLSWFILNFDMIFNEHSVVWWFHFSFKLRLLLFLNWIFLLWLRTLARTLLTLQYKNDWN